MPLLESGVRALSNRMPKVISPQTHAIIDFAFAGSFILAGALTWKGQRKKSAISSWIVAGTELGLSLVTDYPGGVVPLISFSTHGKIDAGISGLIGSMPSLMEFSHEWPSWFFRAQGMSLAVVTGMTDFTGVRGSRYRRYRAA